METNQSGAAVLLKEAQPFWLLCSLCYWAAGGAVQGDLLITVKTKLGLGAQHVTVRDGVALADDKATPEIENNVLLTVGFDIL